MPGKKAISGYKTMWLFAMFDLPVDSAPARRAYTRFRKALLNEGFTMLQFSVYARPCATEEIGHAHRKRIRDILPDEGEVRLVSITDTQFSKMEIFLGKTRGEPEKEMEQLMFF